MDMRSSVTVLRQGRAVGVSRPVTYVGRGACTVKSRAGSRRRLAGTMSAHQCHLRRIAEEGAGDIRADDRVPGMRPIDEQGLAREQVALDVVFRIAVLILAGPEAAVRALRTVVAEHQELVVLEDERITLSHVLKREPLAWI